MKNFSSFEAFKTVLTFFKNRSILIIVSVVVILYPLLLVLNIDAHFNIDWYHNMWLIGYFGEYFFHHHAFPLVINTSLYTNINMPFFYGYLFYPSLGLVSSILGPNITLRLAIVLAFSAQFLVTLALIKKLTQNIWMGIGIACLSIWAIYPLTNLYNRSAILEFFAVTFLFTAICIWFLSTMCAGYQGKILLRVLFALCFSFSIGTHPITGFYGSIYIGVLILVSIVSNIKKQHFKGEFFSVVMVCVIVLLILLPWIYVILKFNDQLAISHYFDRKLLFFTGIDKLWVRLSPFPLDLRSIKTGITNLGAPYLETQINIPMLTYLIFQIVGLVYFRQKLKFSLLMIKKEKALLVLMLFSLFSFLYFFIVSLSQSAARMSLWLLWRAQFAYRFVTYQNLSIFLGVIVIFMLIRKIDVQISFKPIIKYILIGCLVLSAQSVLIKLVHANSIVGLFVGESSEGDEFLNGYGIDRQNKDNLIKLPITFSYPILDYSTGLAGMGQNPDLSLRKIDRNISVQTGNNFGMLRQINIYINEPVLLGVNIAPFPWNNIYVNGQLVDRKDTFLIDGRTYLQLKPGAYEIAVSINPDFLWEISRYISFFTIITCGIYLIFSVRKIKDTILKPISI